MNDADQSSDVIIQFVGQWKLKEETPYSCNLERSKSRKAADAQVCMYIGLTIYYHIQIERLR